MIEIENENDPLKALGISWDSEKDEFFLNQGEKLAHLVDEEIKRSIISISSTLVDPMGWSGPFIVRAKRVYQEIWVQNLKVSINRTVCWSDSLAALNWIRKPSRS